MMQKKAIFLLKPQFRIDQWEAVNFDEWKEIDYDKNGTTDAYLQEYELNNENNGVLIGIDKNEDE